jgi:hypothetical protein
LSGIQLILSQDVRKSSQREVAGSLVVGKSGGLAQTFEVCEPRAKCQVFADPKGVRHPPPATTLLAWRVSILSPHVQHADLVLSDHGTRWMIVEAKRAQARFHRIGVRWKAGSAESPFLRLCGFSLIFVFAHRQAARSGRWTGQLELPGPIYAYSHECSTTATPPAGAPILLSLRA